MPILIMDRSPPFLIVVPEIYFVCGTPGASLHINSGYLREKNIYVTFVPSPFNLSASPDDWLAMLNFRVYYNSFFHLCPSLPFHFKSTEAHVVQGQKKWER